MTEGPHFIVVKGTNQRWMLTVGATASPRIYDTSEIAQKAIDDSIASRTAQKLSNHIAFEPISATEYDKKYSKLLGNMEV